ncbi:MAG: hypothetical protein IIV29_03085 [Tidjanibacter sp.]|nr:hypothetical protein [Tidjanibacter sp.]
MASLLAVVVLAFVLLHIIGVAIQTYNIANGTWEPAIDWSIAGWLKIAIVALRAVMTLVLLVMLVKFVSNILWNHSQLFVRPNVSLLFWAIAPMLLYALCDCNMHILSGERYFAITTESLVAPLVVLVVAIIYRRCVLLTEENDLTI